jgi:hypothetical protein
MPFLNPDLPVKPDFCRPNSPSAKARPPPLKKRGLTTKKTMTIQGYPIKKPQAA